MPKPKFVVSDVSDVEEIIRTEEHKDELRAEGKPTLTPLDVDIESKFAAQTEVIPVPHWREAIQPKGELAAWDQNPAYTGRFYFTDSIGDKFFVRFLQKLPNGKYAIEYIKPQVFEDKGDLIDAIVLASDLMVEVNNTNKGTKLNTWSVEEFENPNEGWDEEFHGNTVGLDRRERHVLLRSLSSPVLWVHDAYLGCWLPSEVTTDFVIYLEELQEKIEQDNHTELNPHRLQQLAACGLLPRTGRAASWSALTEFNNVNHLAGIPEILNANYCLFLEQYVRRNRHLWTENKISRVSGLPLIQYLHRKLQMFVNTVVSNSTFLIPYREMAVIATPGADRVGDKELKPVQTLAISLGGFPQHPTMTTPAWYYHTLDRVKNLIHHPHFMPGDGVMYPTFGDDPANWDKLDDVKDIVFLRLSYIEERFTR